MTMRLAFIYANARGEEVSDSLTRELTDGIAHAHSVWPELRVDDEEFALYVGSRVSAGKNAWADLYLAWACARNDPAALRGFEDAIVRDVKTSLSRTVDSATLEDALQVARRDLFVNGKITQYDGRGPLKGWLRVAVLRVAVRANQQKDRQAGGSDEHVNLLRIATDDPEAALLKLTTRENFRTAFRLAIDSLDAQDALVLRQHLVDELSIDEIGKLKRVHRATAARWIVRAKENLLTELRKRFAAEARVSEEECESAIRLIQSQFDVSVQRLLSERA